MTLAVGIGFVCFDLVDKLSKEQTIRYAITWPLSAVNSRLRMLQDPLKIALESFRMTHLRSCTVHTDTPDSTTSTNQHLALRQKKSLSR